MVQILDDQGKASLRREVQVRIYSDTYIFNLKIRSCLEAERKCIGCMVDFSL